MAGQQPAMYFDCERLGRLTILWTRFLMATVPLAVAITLLDTDHKSTFAPDRLVSGIEGGWRVDAVLGGSFVVTAVYLVQLVYWMRWQFRVHRNLVALGRPGTGISPAMGVVWWFVPFANFVVPYWNLARVWRATNLSDDRPGTDLPAIPVWLLSWWVLGVLSNAVTYHGTRVAFTEATVSEYIFANYVYLGSLPVYLGLLLLDVRLVGEITNSQSRRASELVFS